MRNIILRPYFASNIILRPVKILIFGQSSKIILNCVHFDLNYKLVRTQNNFFILRVASNIFLLKIIH
jgi:hypothetical protein